MRFAFTKKQLDFACQGLNMNRQAKDIAHKYFVLMNKKSDIAKKHGVSAPYVGSLIAKIESNLKKMLELNNMKVIIKFQRKDDKNYYF